MVSDPRPIEHVFALLVAEAIADVILYHTRSIGKKSGDLAGQFKTSTASSCKRSVI